MIRENNQKSIHIFQIIWDILMFTTIILMYIYSDSKTDNALFYRACLVFCAYSLLIYFTNLHLRVPTALPQFSYVLFLFYAGSSMLWARTMQMPAFRLLLVAVAMSIMISYYLNSEIQFDKISVAFIFAGIILCFTVINNYGRSLFNLGKRIRIVNFNANTIGIMLTLSIFACIYLYMRYKRRIILAIIPLFVVFVFLTGSRKAFLAAGIMIAVTFIKMSHSSLKVFIRILVVCVGLFIIWQLLMNVEWAYQAIGHRIESTMNLIFSGEQGEDKNRIKMVELAFNLFLRKPIFGNGLDTFRLLNGVFDSYSHSNFFELLCDFGIVGTILYYLRYVRVLTILKNVFKKDISTIMYLLLLIMLIYEFAAVSYYTVFFQMVFALGYKGTFMFMEKAIEEEGHEEMAYEEKESEE